MSDKTKIEWADVPGHPGYRASRDGQILGPQGKVLRPMSMDAGHLYVITGARRKLWVHHAVLLTYVGLRPDGAGRTQFDNAQDRRRNRGYPTGVEAGSPLSVEAVRAIRADGRASRLVAADHGVSHTTVLKIRRGERWVA